MIRIKERKTWFALLALLLLFAACKGETPTAPPPGGGVPPGGTTPPTGASLVLTTSNANPFVDNTVVITATVTENGQPAPNGTAVEFTTTNGTFTNVTPAVQAIIRTTTNGVATVNLTSSTPVVARVTATVNNITRTLDVNFRAVAPCVPPDPACPPNETPTITSISPTRGRPEGGQIVRIFGTNFFATVRVLFETGTGTTTEAIIVNSTESTIDVLTPAINLGAAQQFLSDITVITRSGAANEKRVVAADGFTFENVALTPIVFSLSPTSGPINGGTRVTIFGEGFQAPLQVFFGSAEANVVEVQFGQIIVTAPDGRSTNPNGSGTVTGPVAVSVVNIRSNTRGTSPQTFRYLAKMQITTVRPITGSALGGTDLVIDGIGFDSPLFITLTDPTSFLSVQANVIRVSGTEILARTAPLPSPCGGGLFQIIVTNTENGDFDVWGPPTATEAGFRYVGVSPQITSVTTASPGNNVTVVVQNPGVGPLGTGSIRFTLNGVTLIPSPSEISNGTGSQSFSIALPTTGFTFPTESCTTGGGAPGTRFAPLSLPLTFTNATAGCSTTSTIVIQPPSSTCVQLPAIAAQTQPAPGTCADAGSVSIVDPATGVAQITFRNNAIVGAEDLIVTAGTPTGANASEFTIAPPSQTIPPQQTRSFTVTFNPAATGDRSAFVVFTTNDPANGAFTICLEGEGIP